MKNLNFLQLFMISIAFIIIKKKGELYGYIIYSS